MAELILGTAQLGSAYGISNRAGRPTREQAAAILEMAVGCGIVSFDTAPAYCSEGVVGERLGSLAGIRLMTKTAVVEGQRIKTSDLDRVEAGLHTSLRLLRRERLDALLVHHARVLLLPDGARLAELLLTLRERGLVRRLGLSVYDPMELEAAAAVLRPEIVQLPLSVLDQRFADPARRLAEAGVEVHARSVFLQGALLMDPEDFPQGLEGLADSVETVRAEAQRVGRSPLEWTLAYALGAPGVRGVVVGANSAAELDELTAAADGIRLDRERLHAFALTDLDLIDPRRWSTK